MFKNNFKFKLKIFKDLCKYLIQSKFIILRNIAQLTINYKKIKLFKIREFSYDGSYFKFILDVATLIQNYTTNISLLTLFYNFFIVIFQ